MKNLDINTYPFGISRLGFFNCLIKLVNVLLQLGIKIFQIGRFLVRFVFDGSCLILLVEELDLAQGLYCILFELLEFENKSVLTKDRIQSNKVIYTGAHI